LHFGNDAQVWDILQNEPKYYPAFSKSQLYIKLLAELDLLREGSSGENMSGTDNASDTSSRTVSISANPNPNPHILF
jgi:hypothetical protein